MPEENELFGSADQVALMRRAKSSWTLVLDDASYSFYGRMVSLCNPGIDAPDRVGALARLQGATSCQYYPAAQASRLSAALDARGIRTSRYEQCWGGEDAVAASRRLLDQHSLPDDLTVVTVDADTPPAQVADLAQLSLDCEVMPVDGSPMRGLSRRGVCLLATDLDGKAVATASSYLSNHPSSPHATDAFWGMLATRQDRRGERIGLLLGARAIVSMWETHGARAFTTGVEKDNSASMPLRSRLGVIVSDWVFIGCIDPGTFAGSSITK